MRATQVCMCLVDVPQENVGQTANRMACCVSADGSPLHCRYALLPAPHPLGTFYSVLAGVKNTANALVMHLQAPQQCGGPEDCMGDAHHPSRPCVDKGETDGHGHRYADTPGKEHAVVFACPQDHLCECGRGAEGVHIGLHPGSSMSTSAMRGARGTRGARGALQRG